MPALAITDFGGGFVFSASQYSDGDLHVERKLTRLS
jgi:hypothetical protein